METVMSNEVVVVSVAVSAYGFSLCRLAVPVLLGYCVTSPASPVSAYAYILNKFVVVSS